MNMDPDAMDFNTSMMMVTGNFSRPTSGNNRSQIFFIVTTWVLFSMLAAMIKFLEKV